MRIRIIAFFGFILILGPNDMFGQKTKGAKNKALDLEQVEKEIQAVMEIYQPYAEKYMNELKR
ncbi:MAG: hypothetical protein IPP37_07240 [Saprospiraceae bacterium]|nr:hypothetical protein [Saprospiraceae bacterium]